MTKLYYFEISGLFSATSDYGVLAFARQENSKV